MRCSCFERLDAEVNPRCRTCAGKGAYTPSLEELVEYLSDVLLEEAHHLDPREVLAAVVAALDDLD